MMRRQTRIRLLDYCLAVCLSALAALIAEMFRTIFVGAPFLPFLTAVVLSACIGGFGPGLVATVFGAFAANFLLMPPPYVLSITGGGDLVRLGMFVLVSTIISAACSVMHANRRTAELRARDLQVSEERHRRIVETAHEAIFDRDAEGRIRYANARMTQLLGYSLAELLGR